MNKTIREDISSALGFSIPGGQWEPYIDIMDRDGKFTRKNLLSMVMELCKHVEWLESMVGLPNPEPKAVLSPIQSPTATKNDTKRA